MQPFRIRSNNTTTQGFTNAELDFAFYCSPPLGFSDICYPKLKLSTNDAQPVMLYLSSKTRPTRLRKPKLLGKWSLGHLLPSLPRGPAAENHPAARVLSLSFGIMELRTAPE